ncbi:hypothetical protein CKO43_14380, partial [Rubrivivax gelatinosus]|nr:hypothetical protein [Rubrivivax gelatinosus]
VIDTIPPAPPRREARLREPTADPLAPLHDTPLEPPPRDGVTRWMLGAFLLAALLGLGLWWFELRDPAAARQPAGVAAPAAATQVEPALPLPDQAAVGVPPAATTTPAPTAAPPREEFIDPPRTEAARRGEPAAPNSPRAACGERSDFALYRCFQQQCARGTWAGHPQCQEFRATDRVPA